MNASDYDRLVNWERRLEREWPFYERLFRLRPTSTILDCACGTGRHAVLFAKKGFRVTATDKDPAMIGRARENAERSRAEIEFTVASFSSLGRAFPSPRFDAVICVGNSLSQLEAMGEVEDALRNMASVCRPGGVLVLHVLNYASLMAKPLVAQPLRVACDGRLLFQKIFIPRIEAVEMIVIKMEEGEGGWASSVHSGRLLPLMPSALEQTAAASGFTRIETAGDYEGSDFDPARSWDFILTASRRP